MTFNPNRKTCSDMQTRFTEVCNMTLVDIVGEPGTLTAAELEAWMLACQEISLELYERLLHLETCQNALKKRIA